MGLRRDERGRPIGLNWPKDPEPVEPEVQKKHNAAVFITYARGTNSTKPRQEKCGKGLHDMAESGVEMKNGGRYCRTCKNEYRKAWQKNKRRKTGKR